jgi:hypothetical protein
MRKDRMYPMKRGVSRLGWLKNGNQPGDFAKAPRCGAKTRRGTACQCPAMRNGRCRLHGGLSTGAKTAEGIERSRNANLRHGNYSAAAERRRREMRELMLASRSLLAEMQRESFA